MNLLLTERRDGIAIVTLNRPEKRNALSIELRELLAAEFERIDRDDAVSCVVLTGAGTAFCAGMDTTQFGGDADHKRKLVESSTAAFEAVGSCSKALICAVNGPACAGGFALAMLGDIRIASPAASFGFPEMEFGIAASYASLRGVVTPGVARELCLTGRTVDAGEALQLGLVNEVVAEDDPSLRALVVAQRIASLPSHAVLEVKRRILFEAEQGFGKLFGEEIRVFREELLTSESRTKSR